MDIDQSHRLLAHELSPAPWPPRIGEIVILYTSPESKTRGYVGVVEASHLRQYQVRYLDAPQGQTFDICIDDLISTGLKPQDLCTQYEPSPVGLSCALEIERTFPDFELFKTTKSKTSQSKTNKTKTKKSLAQSLKGLDESQLKALASVLVSKIKETKKDETETTLHKKDARV